MTALAHLHALPLPAAAARAPILSDADPLAALLAEIEIRGHHLDCAALGCEVHRLIAAEIARFHGLCAQAARPPRCLIAFDAHPGNFVVRDSDGVAVLSPSRSAATPRRRSTLRTPRSTPRPPGTLPASPSRRTRPAPPTRRARPASVPLPRSMLRCTCLCAVRCGRSR